MEGINNKEKAKIKIQSLFWYQGKPTTTTLYPIRWDRLHGSTFAIMFYQVLCNWIKKNVFFSYLLMMCELGKKKGENNKERTKNNEMKIIEKNNYIKGVQVKLEVKKNQIF